MEKINIKRSFNLNDCSKKKKIIIILLVIILILLIIYNMIINRVMPTFLSLSNHKSKNMSTRIINQVVIEKMSNVAYSDIVTFQENDEGQITMIKVNSVALNSLASQISIGIQDKLSDIDDTTINIPLGSLLGNDLFTRSSDQK